MRYLFLAISFFLFQGLIAQNYSPFDAEVSKRFVNSNDSEDDDYFFYSTADTNINNSITFNQYYTVKEEGEIGLDISNCDFWGGTIGKEIDTTWLGNRIFYKTLDKNLILLNEIGDSLNFNFRIDIGDSSLFYASDTMEFYIKYSAINFESHFGVEDSCKYFTIQSYDTLGIVQNNYLSGFEIKLSKNLGILSFIDCYHFPELLVSVEIRGQTNPLLGDYQLSYEIAYPWGEGDVIQYRSSRGFPGTNANLFTYETITITSRIETVDSVYIYYSSELEEVYTGDGGSIDGPIIPLTSPISFNINDLILTIPHNMAVRNEYIAAEFYSENETIPCNASENIVYKGEFAVYCDSCLCYGNTDGFGTYRFTKYFGENRGWYKYYANEYGPIDEIDDWSIIQIYSNIDNVECGNLWVLGVDEIENNAFSVFPNPSKGDFSVSSKLIPRSILVYDQSGRKVYFNNTFYSLKNQINLDAIDSGVYLLQIEFDEGTFTKKLIIQ